MVTMGAFGELETKSHDDLFDSVDQRRAAHTWLLYGGQGTGKTFTSMTFPEPVFVIDTELRSDITANQFPERDIRVFEPGEISFDDVDPDNPLEDAIDVPGSLDNINQSVISLVNAHRDGELEGGTVVLDSVTDLWDWSQEWGKQRLMDAGGIDRADFSLENQFDWGIIKNKHNKILTGIRTLSKKYGVEVVLTAREKKRPEYTEGGGEHYIKCEKTVPFWAEVTVRFQKQVRKGQTKHIATFDKLGANNQPDGEVVDPTYDDLKRCLDEGGIPDDINEGEDEDEEGGF